jgi:hypothetical protein
LPIGIALQNITFYTHFADLAHNPGHFCSSQNSVIPLKTVFFSREALLAERSGSSTKAVSHLVHNQLAPSMPFAGRFIPYSVVK